MCLVAHPCFLVLFHHMFDFYLRLPLDCPQVQEKLVAAATAAEAARAEAAAALAQAEASAAAAQHAQQQLQQVTQEAAARLASQVGDDDACSGSLLVAPDCVQLVTAGLCHAMCQQQ